MKGCKYCRTPKERGADKTKITCLNCKHLMFSDMYGECKIQLRIVNPSDTCEYAEPKERGGEELRKKQMTPENAIKILKGLYKTYSTKRTKNSARYADTQIPIHTAEPADNGSIGVISHDPLPQNPTGNARQRAC